MSPVFLTSFPPGAILVPMPAFAFLALEKLKSQGSLRHILEHDTRDRSPPYAYPERLHLNVLEHSTDDAMRHYQDRLPAKVRKNAVHAVEFVVQGSNTAPTIDHKAFFTASVDWLTAKLGGSDNRLTYSFHFDEESPHLHLLMMPLRGGELNYNSYLGGSKFQLRDLQTDFATEVAGRFGLSRGIERSGIENRNHNAYRQQMAVPLAGLPEVALPNPTAWLLNVKGYGEEIARLHKDAYIPLVERLTGTTNRARVLEEDIQQVKAVSSARAKENDSLRAELAGLRTMIRDNTPELAAYRSKLILAEGQKTKAVEPPNTQGLKQQGPRRATARSGQRVPGEGSFKVEGLKEYKKGLVAALEMIAKAWAMVVANDRRLRIPPPGAMMDPLQKALREIDKSIEEAMRNMQRSGKDREDDRGF